MTHTTQQTATKAAKKAYRVAVGEKIKTARLERGLSQEDVEIKAGFGQGILCHYEKGSRSPGPQNLSKLCAVLDVDVNWLIDATPAA